MFDRACICKLGRQAATNFPHEDYSVEWHELVGGCLVNCQQQVGSVTFERLSDPPTAVVNGTHAVILLLA